MAAMSGDSNTVMRGNAGGITVIHADRTCGTWNGIQSRTGPSGVNTGATALSMNAGIPSGGVAAAHVDVGFGVMLDILEWRVRHLFWEGCGKTLDNEPSDFIVIEPGVPHEVHDLSDAAPVVAVVGRSAPDEWNRIASYARP